MTSWKILSGLQFYYCEQLTPDERWNQPFTTWFIWGNISVASAEFLVRTEKTVWKEMWLYSFGVKIQTFFWLLNRKNRGLADFKNYFLRHDPMCFRRHLEIFGYFACQLSVNPRGFSPHFCGLVNFNFRKEAKKLRSKLKPPTLSFFQALKSDICWILFVVSQIVLELQSRQQIRMLFRGYSKSCEDWHCPDLCARLQFALCIQFFEVFRVEIISVISWRMNNEL